jgi:hypothetical protein
MRLAGSGPGLTTPGISRQATHLYLANLAATTQQKDNKEDRNWNSEQPEKNVSGRASFLESLRKFHVVVLV